MKEFINIFSLTSQGEIPVGLQQIRQPEKLNQPSLDDQKQFNFAPIFQQAYDFFFEDDDDEENYEDNNSVNNESELSWISLYKKHNSEERRFY